MAERLVALMRGINVGKAKRVAMADLRALLEQLGYADVRTHLNSGNAVFTSTAKLARGAAARIEQAIADELGVSCSVIVRTGAELTAAAEANPLLAVGTDPAKLLVGFLAAVPEPDRVAALLAREVAPDEIRLIGQEVFLWCPAGVLDSPFSKVAWERELGVSVTMRNWNTVRKLVELVEADR